MGAASAARHVGAAGIGIPSRLAQAPAERHAHAPGQRIDCVIHDGGGADVPRAPSPLAPGTRTILCVPPTTIHLADVDVELSPYELPADSIIAGDPKARGHVVCRHESDGSRLVSGIYACSPGTVRARGSSTETIHVLEGDVSIELSNGHCIDLGPGDVAVLPAGHEATWTFHSQFKEVFVLTA